MKAKEPAGNPESIDLRCELSWRHALRFPLQSKAARRDLFIGGLWLLVPVFGWLLNMGHRIRVVHRLQRGEEPWPAWGAPGELLLHGCWTFLGMAFYGAPGLALIGLGWWGAQPLLSALGGGVLLLAIIAIPGYMSHYCRAYDRREIFDPRRALSRVRQGGAAYWRAWSYVIPTMLLSLLGLPLLVVGFVWTSVWFWQVAAFCFATVFTQRFDLDGGHLEGR